MAIRKSDYKRFELQFKKLEPKFVWS